MTKSGGGSFSAGEKIERSGLERAVADREIVIAAGNLLESKDYQGRIGCSSPHKIVEFELPASVPILLEFSSAGSREIRVSITAAPLPKS